MTVRPECVYESGPCKNLSCSKLITFFFFLTQILFDFKKKTTKNNSASGIDAFCPGITVYLVSFRVFSGVSVVRLVHCPFVPFGVEFRLLESQCISESFHIVNLLNCVQPAPQSGRVLSTPFPGDCLLGRS